MKSNIAILRNMENSYTSKNARSKWFTFPLYKWYLISKGTVENPFFEFPGSVRFRGVITVNYLESTVVKILI